MSNDDAMDEAMKKSVEQHAREVQRHLALQGTTVIQPRLIQLPMLGDWVDPTLVRVVEAVPGEGPSFEDWKAWDKRARKFPEVQVLVTDGNFSRLFKIPCRTMQQAQELRDKIVNDTLFPRFTIEVEPKNPTDPNPNLP